MCTWRVTKGCIVYHLPGKRVSAFPNTLSAFSDEMMSSLQLFLVSCSPSLMTQIGKYSSYNNILRYDDICHDANAFPGLFSISDNSDE